MQPRKTRTIEIEAFVELAEVDPIYFDHPYFLVPAGESEGTMRAYRLLVEVMASQERIALGRFVMRTKEYLAAVRARDEGLALTTMRFHDEVRDPAGARRAGKKPSKKALERATAIIEGLSTEWDPASYTDCYRERLKKVIDRKRKGAKIEAPEPESEPKSAPDLMAALEETLKRVKAGESASAVREDRERGPDVAIRDRAGPRARNQGSLGPQIRRGRGARAPGDTRRRQPERIRKGAVPFQARR